MLEVCLGFWHPGYYGEVWKEEESGFLCGHAPLAPWMPGPLGRVSGWTKPRTGHPEVWCPEVCLGLKKILISTVVSFKL